MKFFGLGIYKKLKRINVKFSFNPPVLDMNEQDDSDYWTAYEGGTTQSLDRKLHKNLIIAVLVEGQLKDATVLDLGCGFGRMNLFFDMKEYHGFDSNERMLNNAKKLNLKRYNSFFWLGDGRTLKPLPDSFFDIVICNTVMLHLKVRTVEGYAKEIYRVLKLNGFFLANFPEKRNLNIHKVFYQFDIEPIGKWFQDDAFIFRKVK